MIGLALAGVAAGAPLPNVVIALVSVRFPLPSAAGLLLAAAWERRRSGSGWGREVAALVAVASELRSGSGLRQALAAGGTLLPEGARITRLSAAGRPMQEVAEALADAFPRHGQMAAAAVRLSGRVGGALAPLFETLATQAIAAEELERERRVAAAPAIAQGVVVGGLPLLALVRMIVGGDLVRLAASGPLGATLAIVGVSSTLTGVLAVSTMVWRAGR